MNGGAFVATFDFRDSTVSFCSLPVVDGQLIDTGEITPLSDFEEDGCDSVIEILEANEVPSDELKSELEERLRLRMAHHDLCDPNVPLREKSIPVDCRVGAYGTLEHIEYHGYNYMVRNEVSRKARL